MGHNGTSCRGYLDVVVLKVILVIFDAIVSKWPVTCLWYGIMRETDTLKFNMVVNAEAWTVSIIESV